MSRINSLSSFQYDDIDPAMGRYPDFAPVPPPITTPSSGSLLEQSFPGGIGNMATSARTQSLKTTDQLSPVSGALHDVSTTQSLITALQATMSPAAIRPPVVIPGRRNRIKTTEELREERHIHPHLRLAITLGAMIVILATTLISLSPLGSGQNTGTLIGGTLQWIQAQQENRDIVGHTFVTLAQANTAPAHHAASTNTATSALPPMAVASGDYVAIARQDAINNGINPDYFQRQIQQESGFNPGAASPAGAVGIAQFEPSTAAGLGINPYNPIEALAGAARYMANLASQYNGNYAMALAAYNAGGGAVSYAVAAGGANWISFLPAETQNYLLVIMGV